MDYGEYYKIAEDYYVKGDYEKALDFFKQSLNKKETNDCLNYIGCCYLKLEDYTSATEIFEMLISIMPEWERPIFNLGRVNLETGALEKALDCFKKSVVINPNNEDIYYYLGVYYYKIGDYESAKEYYQKSVEINDEQPETHLNLGVCYFKLNMFKKALEEFEFACKYDSDCSDAIYNKGITLISMCKYQEAVDNFLIVSNLKPDDIEVMMDIAHCYYKLGNYRYSKVWVNKLLSKEPKHDLANKLYKRLMNLTNQPDN